MSCHAVCERRICEMGMGGEPVSLCKWVGSVGMPGFLPAGGARLWWCWADQYVRKVSFYDKQHHHYTLGRYDAERDVFIGERCNVKQSIMGCSRVSIVGCGQTCRWNIEFELLSFVGAEPFDARWTVDPAELCRDNGADADGGIGPLGLLVLAMDNSVELRCCLLQGLQIHWSENVCHDHISQQIHKLSETSVL